MEVENKEKVLKNIKTIRNTLDVLEFVINDTQSYSKDFINLKLDLLQIDLNEIKKDLQKGV